MPINLVYRGGSGSSVTIPDGTVIWDGEKYETYGGEGLFIFTPDECAEVVSQLTALADDFSALESRIGAIENIGVAEDGVY